MERRDKQNAQLADDAARLRDKVDKLLKTIDELQASESSNQLSARRAERELREEREKTLRLEREVEGWKLRTERGGSVPPSVSGSVLGSVAGSVIGGGYAGSMRRTGTQTTFRSGLSSSEPPEDFASPDIPKRKSSIGRARVPSMTKGFL